MSKESAPPLLTYRAAPTGVAVDVDRLVASRMLIQANSGGGKSRAIRQLLEETHGRVPHLVLDPEGEFATLRERFDYVLAAKQGGDVALAPAHARVLCRRLVELGASAVLDLYELTLPERREFVRLFLTELMALPRALWRPLLVVIDEAHLFVPERGSGEAQSTEAVISLCTQGRKRGFCAVLATQRVSKLHKDAAAELLNKLIGRTGLDIDQRRAGDELGLAKEGRAALARLAPGEFYVYGPAISPTIAKVRTGAVLTTHPEAGRIGAAPPPAPTAIRALLAQLQDLPAEAAAEARSLEELRRENAQLKAAACAKSASALPATPTVERVVDQAAIAAAVDTAVAAEERYWIGWLAKLETVCQQHAGALTQLFVQQARELGGRRERAARRPESVTRPTPLAPERAPSPAAASTKRPHDLRALNASLQKVLDAVAWFEAVGIPEPQQVAVAALAGYTAGAGRFSNLRGELRALGLIEYRGDRFALTAAGRQHAQTPETAPTTEALHERVLAKLDASEAKLLRVLLAVWPDAMSKEGLAAATGYTAGAGRFGNLCGALRSLGFVDYPAAGLIRAEDLLFPTALGGAR